jgi:hypothetical protein
MDGMQHLQTSFDFSSVDPKKKQSAKRTEYTPEMKETSQMAASISENMSSRDRLKHEKLARKKNKDMCEEECKRTKNPPSRHVQKNNTDERGKKEVCKRQERLTQEVERTVRSLDRRTSLKTYRFHIVHMNYYCQMTNGAYSPCEIALAEFSLVDGITKTYHTLINPGHIPFGYTFDAHIHTAETHRIPLPPENLCGESNHLKILTNIKLFLMGDNRDKSNLPPIYAQTSDIDAVESILGMLNKAVSPAEKGTFRVISLSKLFYELRNASMGIVTADLPVDFTAEGDLQNDIFDFTAGISCPFHEQTDARKYCSLSCVQRWSFVIMNSCCRNLKIDMIPCRHYPSCNGLLKEDKSVSLSSRNYYPNPYTFDRDKYFPSYPSEQLLSSQKCGQRVMKTSEPTKISTGEGNKQLKIQPKAEPLLCGPLKPYRRPKTMPLALLLMSTSVIREKHIPAIPAVDKSEGADAMDVRRMKQL